MIFAKILLNLLMVTLIFTIDELVIPSKYNDSIINAKSKLNILLKDCQQQRIKSLTNSLGQTQTLRITDLTISKSLPEMISEFLYTVEAFQSKETTELNNLKDEVIKNCEDVDIVREELKAAIESFKVQETNYINEIEELQKQLHIISNEKSDTIYNIQREYKDNISRIKEDNITDISVLTGEYNKKIDEIHKEYKYEIIQYEKEIKELKEINIKLETSTSDVSTILYDIQERLKKYYEIHLEENKTFKGNPKDEKFYLDFLLVQME